MVTVPTVGNTRRQETRAIGAPGFGSNLRLPELNVPTSTAGRQIAKAAIDITDDMAAAAKERADATALLKAQKAMDDWEANNLFKPETGAFAKKGQNAFNLPNSVMAQYDKDMKALSKDMSTDQLNAFNKMYTSRRGNIAQSLLTHERTEMDGFRKATATAAADSSIQRAALNANDAKVRDAAVTNAVDSMRSYFEKDQGLTGIALEQELAKVEGKARLGVLTRLADENPHSAVAYFDGNAEKFGPELLTAQKLISTTKKTVEATDIANNALGSYAPKQDADSIIGFVQGPLEGGSTINPNDGGSISKFGVRQESNPDVKVADLDETAARNLAKEKYWDNANGLLPKGTLDALPPQMRLVVFDRVYNGYDKRVTGVPLEKMIEDANGDPYKFLESSADYLQQVAVKNPEKTKELTGWMNRISKLRTQVDAMYGTPPSEEEVFAQISRSSNNPEVVEAAKTLAKKQIDQRNAAIKDGYTKAADEAAKYQLEGREVPPSVIARMEPKAAVEMQKKQYDPITYERVRNQVAYGQPVDLEEVRWKMSPTQYEELRRAQTNAGEQAIMRKVDEEINDSIQAVVGKKKASEAKDFERLAEFRNIIMSDITDMKAKKIAVDDDAIEKLVDGAVKKRAGGLFGSGTYEVKKIPDDRNYMVGGQAVPYPELMATLSAYAQKRNIPVTDENLAGIYRTLKSKGLVKEQN